jgi:hypothetical protein
MALLAAGGCFVSLAFAVGGLIPNMENMLKLAGFQHPISCR